MITIPCVLSSIVADNLEHQLVGGSDNFSTGYICRWCAANHRQIQSATINKPLLGTHKDVVEYWGLVNRVDENGNLPVNKLGVQRIFQFASRKFNMHPWNVCPPNLTHDLNEGVMPKFTSFILTHLGFIFKIPKTRIALFVNNYQFYYTQFKISPVTGGFKIIGSAVEVGSYF